MGFFGSGDKSNISTATQTGVSDSGRLLGTNAAGGEGQSFNLGGGNALSTIKVGSTEIGDVSSNSLFNSTNTGTINYGLSVTDASKLLTDATTGIADLVTKQTDAARGQVADVVAGIQDLALSKQTDGQSGTNKTFLYVALGVLALFALIFWRK